MTAWLARLPVRARVTAWYVLLLALILATLGSFLLLRLRADLVAEVDEGLGAQAAEVMADDDGVAVISGRPVAGLPPGETAAQLVSATGQVKERAGSAAPGQSMLAPAMLRRVLAGHQVRGEVRVGPERARYRVLALRRNAGKGGTALVLAAPLSDVDRSVERLRLLLVIAGPVALALAGGGGWLLTRAALRPVDRMTEQAGAIGADRLGDRVSVPDAADELTRLARTLNGMLERIEHGVVTQRRFVADASHELRTPLAVMRAELEVALRDHNRADSSEVLDSAAEEVTRMSQIVDDLLTLAHRDENRLELLLEPVDLGKVTTGVAGQLRPLAEAAGVQLMVEAPAGAVVLADQARLTQVVTNLVDNAVKFTGAGGAVRVRVWEVDDGAGLAVADTGPGIAPEHLRRVFDRFYRLDPARSRARGGSGLGLAICRELVEAHGGRIWAESVEGAGSTFSLALPIQPPALASKPGP